MGGCYANPCFDSTLSGLICIWGSLPRVARSSQPWAECLQSLQDCPARHTAVGTAASLIQFNPFHARRLSQNVQTPGGGRLASHILCFFAPVSPMVAVSKCARGIAPFWPPLLWTAVAERSSDTAFDFTEALGNSVLNPAKPSYCLSLYQRGGHIRSFSLRQGQSN
jgi:hypothetical protein